MDDEEIRPWERLEAVLKAVDDFGARYYRTVVWFFILPTQPGYQYLIKQSLRETRHRLGPLTFLVATAILFLFSIKLVTLLPENQSLLSQQIGDVLFQTDELHLILAIIPACFLVLAVVRTTVRLSALLLRLRLRQDYLTYTLGVYLLGQTMLTAGVFVFIIFSQILMRHPTFDVPLKEYTEQVYLICSVFPLLYAYFMGCYKLRPCRARFSFMSRSIAFVLILISIIVSMLIWAVSCSLPYMLRNIERGGRAVDAACVACQTTNSSDMREWKFVCLLRNSSDSKLIISKDSVSIVFAPLQQQHGFATELTGLDGLTGDELFSLRTNVWKPSEINCPDEMGPAIVINSGDVSPLTITVNVDESSAQKLLKLNTTDLIWGLQVEQPTETENRTQSRRNGIYVVEMKALIK